MADSTTEHRAARWAIATYPRHRLAFAGVIGSLHVVNLFTGAPWWALWPLVIWGLPFSVHFFVYKSLTVEEDWVDGRIDDLQMNSYDFGHIKDIEHRIEAGDLSVRPSDRRAETRRDSSSGR